MATPISSEVNPKYDFEFSESISIGFLRTDDGACNSEDGIISANALLDKLEMFEVIFLE
jgi:hypothetical protein